MGAVYSCLTSIASAVGGLIMGIFRAIGAALSAVVSAIITVFDAIVGCLTCQGCGGRRRGGGRRAKV